MHLVYTATRTPEYFHQVRAFPSSFAIFSRSWDMIPESPGTFLPADARLDKACEKAIEYGYEWLWTESSCVTNTRKHNLWKSIFELYRMASLCFVYLSDIEKVADWGQSKWFQHAYTLPELVASNEIIFFTKTGKVVGRKSDLCKELSFITGIEEAVLRNPEKVQSCSVAKRMSWASLRDAKEVGKEDLAYCLIGIFLVPDLSVRFNGLTNAMLSLQLEIMKEYQDDLSIFEWQHTDINDPCTNGLLAGSPFQFHLCGDIKTCNNGSKINLASDSNGMFSIHGLIVSQPLGRIGLVLNSYHSDIRPRMYPCIHLSTVPPESPESPESPEVECRRMDISKVYCISAADAMKTPMTQGTIYIREDGTAFIQ
ncbi:hypothetical protein COH20_005857 [Aspergillus flavus]|nr:hypothetical protein COH20_005857 [Aspergillus flavus]RAQ62697.1 hypothetical protein COH21_009823 [Aspergillus flavus]